MGLKVNIETATADINQWLDYKKVSDKKRENYASSINDLISSVCEGVLTFDSDNHQLIQTLNFEIGEETKIGKITFSPRIQIGAIQRALQGVSAANADGRILAYISALTGVSKAIIEKMDSEDYTVAQSIAIFFL